MELTAEGVMVKAVMIPKIVKLNFNSKNALITSAFFFARLILGKAYFNCPRMLGF
jgi:hypothetical protein